MFLRFLLVTVSVGLSGVLSRVSPCSPAGQTHIYSSHFKQNLYWSASCDLIVWSPPDVTLPVWRRRSEASCGERHKHNSTRVCEHMIFWIQHMFVCHLLCCRCDSEMLVSGKWISAVAVSSSSSSSIFWPSSWSSAAVLLESSSSFPLSSPDTQKATRHERLRVRGSKDGWWHECDVTPMSSSSSSSSSVLDVTSCSSSSNVFIFLSPRCLKTLWSSTYNQRKPAANIMWQETECPSGHMTAVAEHDALRASVCRSRTLTGFEPTSLQLAAQIFNH